MRLDQTEVKVRDKTSEMQNRSNSNFEEMMNDKKSTHCTDTSKREANKVSHRIFDSYVGAFLQQLEHVVRSAIARGRQ